LGIRDQEVSQFEASQGKKSETLFQKYPTQKGLVVDGLPSKDEAQSSNLSIAKKYL
jgi:hypothetical protein